MKILIKIIAWLVVLFFFSLLFTDLTLINYGQDYLGMNKVVAYVVDPLGKKSDNVFILSIHAIGLIVSLLIAFKKE